MDKKMNVLDWVFIPLLLVVSGMLIFILINSSFVTTKKTVVTTIEEKEKVPMGVITNWTLVGETLVPVPTILSESYRFHFKIDGNDEKLTVNKITFDSFSVGDRVHVDYGYCRIFGSYEPKAIRQH